MNEKQLSRMKNEKGFIAALDQSGGSTPKALKLYGVSEKEYSTDDEMFGLVHEMRSRIITSPSFSSEYILGAILFEGTMEREIQGKKTADFLWEEKGIVPILKIDKGLADEENDAQMLKPMPDIDKILSKANDYHIFGTKGRSVIKLANKKGIADVVAQQFEIAKQVFAAGLIPIIEPEVDIHSPEKEEAEDILKEELEKQLALLDSDVQVMFKLSLPTKDNHYASLLDNPHVVRIVALSGGYSRQEANQLLSRNRGVIASFSRALSQDLNINQSASEFDETLKKSIRDIYEASVQ